MLFTETNETITVNIYSLFTVFASGEGFFDKLLWLQNETGNANSSF